MQYTNCGFGGKWKRLQAVYRYVVVLGDEQLEEKRMEYLVKSFQGIKLTYMRFAVQFEKPDPGVKK